jgi:hypothetical protein
MSSVYRIGSERSNPDIQIDREGLKAYTLTKAGYLSVVKLSNHFLNITRIALLALGGLAAIAVSSSGSPLLAAASLVFIGVPLILSLWIKAIQVLKLKPEANSDGTKQDPNCSVPSSTLKTSSISVPKKTEFKAYLEQCKEGVIFDS